jgi:hypothetical protein
MWVEMMCDRSSSAGMVPFSLSGTNSAPSSSRHSRSYASVSTCNQTGSDPVSLRTNLVLSLGRSSLGMMV